LALKQSPHSVTHKKIVPPSGDIHDYISYSRYWWPDPNKPDGLPYIRKDGVTNRKLVQKGDRVRLGNFCYDVQALGLAGYVFKDARYTRHAVSMVRAWFIDKATRMNPNMNFGQGVPGRETGRGPGVIDTRGFMEVLDAVELFDEAHWTATDQRALETWFDDYQQWLKESPLGKQEQQATNNHGSWYVAQRARYALFAGREDVAREIVQQARQRITNQFDAAGNQAAELKRTRSLHYSLFNITALSRLARVGDQLDEDLWSYTPDHGCGIKKALEGLLPYMTGESDWEHPSMGKLSISPAARLTLHLFSQHFEDDVFANTAPKIDRFKYRNRDFTVIISGKSETPAPAK
jgi:hypothetical protein